MKLLLWPLGSLLAVSYSGSITLGGVIIASFVGLTGLIVLGYGGRWKAIAQVSGAQADELRKAFEDERGRADKLYHRLTDMVAERNELTLRIARLEERPNLEQIVEIIKSQAIEADKRTATAVEAVLDKIDGRFAASERRQEERHREISDTLKRVADTLERISAT